MTSGMLERESRRGGAEAAGGAAEVTLSMSVWQILPEAINRRESNENRQPGRDRNPASKLAALKNPLFSLGFRMRIIYK